MGGDTEPVFLNVPARVYRIALAVGGLALLAWLGWHNLSDQRNPPVEAADGHAQRIDAARSWQYDDQGSLAYRLVSPRVTHLDDSDRYLLDSPVVTLFEEGPEPPWNLAADQGEVRDKGGIVDLRENVVAHRDPFEDTGRLEMRTAAMRIHPNQHRAESLAATGLSEIDNGTTRWTSDSERFDLDWAAERLTQTGRVRDHIEPATAP